MKKDSVCSCNEGWYEKRGKVIQGPQVHDCRYISDRNKCIPMAESLANTVFPEPPKSQKNAHAEWRVLWSAEFIKQMDIVYKDSVLKEDHA